MEGALARLTRTTAATSAFQQQLAHLMQAHTAGQERWRWADQLRRAAVVVEEMLEETMQSVCDNHTLHRTVEGLLLG